MSTPFTRAPHRGDQVTSTAPSTAPNAALLIDFDNVTMGMRSDLSRDLKKLLESDVIRGKVTVQRAYADWRRYPQYIVPLSENSIDLIFAPAYGSSKKNATDIRMAIDAMELVFVRPEIGTFILLTGDSDFSSCVLKLKEYGKYVVGVGIQESSSDILVQNCDEYYSYSSLTGLSKTTDGDATGSDPWVLVEEAVKRMKERDDVMRSDRLKQVMIEMDAGFDEGKFGFSKFSRFLTEAASKNLVRIRKMDNGQYEVSPTGGGGGGRTSSSSSRSSRDEGRSRRSRRDRDDRKDRDERRDRGRAPDRDDSGGRPAAGSGEPLRDAYELLVSALEALRDDGRHPVRDSDVKRRMLELQRGFDEAELGFSKFSLFLRQADDDEVIDLHRRDSGNYEVALPGAAAAAPSDEPSDSGTARQADDAGPAAGATEPAETAPAVEDRGGEARAESTGKTPATGPVVRELRPEDVVDPDAPGRRLGPRGGTTRRRGGDDDPPPLLPGQTVSGGGSSEAPPARPDSFEEPVDELEPREEVAASPSPTADDFTASDLGLPTDADAQIRYLSNSYRGVGKKTAEALVEGFGEELFDVLRTEPDRVHDVVPAGRADAVLEAWKEDIARRIEQASEEASGNGRGGNGRRGRRGRGGSRRK
jgi:uncharacterized protein (TIGR00288 family)